MKAACILALLALAGTAVYLYQQENTTTNLRSSSDSALFKEYQQWKAQYNQNINGDEDQYRFNIFKSNKKIAEEHNAQQKGSLRLGMNAFAALSLEEFKEKYTTKMTNFGKGYTSKTFTKTADVPESVDWTAKGAVAPVENQGGCGSCWAFSTKEGLEGAYQIKTGKLEVFSAQQLVDCSKWNLGCNGGDPMAAYQYTQKNGIESESDYPYVSGETGQRSECQYNKDKVVFQNSGQVKVAPEDNADAIMAAAANQPLTIEVSAGNIAFQLYQEGVLDSKACGTALDHGVLLTGYNNSGDEPYWTIKNSWGTGWGTKGYGNILLQPTGPGMCGIQQYAAYPEY